MRDDPEPGGIVLDPPTVLEAFREEALSDDERAGLDVILDGVCRVCGRPTP